MVFSHVTSSPHHSRSHGFIERAIRTVKAMMKRTRVTLTWQC